MVKCENCVRSENAITALRAQIRRLKRPKKPLAKFRKYAEMLAAPLITNQVEAARPSAPAGQTPEFVDWFVMRNSRVSSLMRLRIGDLIRTRLGLAKISGFFQAVFQAGRAHEPMFQYISAECWHTIRSWAEAPPFLIQGHFIEFERSPVIEDSFIGDALDRLVYEAKELPSRSLVWSRAYWCEPTPNR